jgi:hypothetical protein
MDKKFCDDACRNYFHNSKNRNVNSLCRAIHSTLRNNRRILEELILQKTVESRDLDRLGFDFNHITKIEVAKNGKNRFFCYDYGYIILKSGKIQILRRE